MYKIRVYIFSVLSLLLLTACNDDGLSDKDIMNIVDNYRQTEFRKSTNTYDTPMANFLSREKFESVENQLMDLKVDILSKEKDEAWNTYNIRIFVSGQITESITTGIPKTHDIQRMYTFSIFDDSGDYTLLEETVVWVN
mgnify:CR=1 FL=1